VRLFAHKGPITVNARPFEEFFPIAFHQLYAVEPIRLVEGDFSASIKVSGGGVSGQAGAVRHGFARALLEFNPELRPELKKAGFLTRDSRAKERKKPGLKRARKAPQYTKR
jgi:small subunit ribosomal protein S9